MPEAYKHINGTTAKKNLWKRLLDKVCPLFDENTERDAIADLASGRENVASSNSDEEQKVLQIINQEREKKRLPPLEWKEDLAHASRYHSYDMGTQDYFNHNSYDRYHGKLKKIASTFHRILRFYSTKSELAENIAKGMSTAKEVYDVWLNSPPHKGTMFNPHAKYVSIGFVETDGVGYWTLETANE